MSVNATTGAGSSALFVLLLLAGLLHSIFNNPRFGWGVVAQSFTEDSIISGVMMTLQLTAISVVLGFAGGTVLALMRLSSNPVLVAVSWGYTWFFRGVPMLVQLFLWYNVAALYPTIAISLPGLGGALQFSGERVDKPL